MHAFVLLYDADCPFCRWAMARILAWDRRRRLRPVPLQDPEAERLLPGMTAAQRMASWHLVSPGGEVWSGGAAAPHLLRLLPGGRSLAAVAAALPGPTEGLYALVARHRGSLARLGLRAPPGGPGRPVKPRPLHPDAGSDGERRSADR